MPRQALVFPPPAFPNERRDRTNKTHRSHSGERIDFWDVRNVLRVRANRRNDKKSNTEPNSHSNPPFVARLSYLRLRRSQMSAAIEPTTPIAASPEEASISGTGVKDA